MLQDAWYSSHSLHDNIKPRGVHVFVFYTIVSVLLVFVLKDQWMREGLGELYHWPWLQSGASSGDAWAVELVWKPDEDARDLFNYITRFHLCIKPNNYVWKVNMKVNI